MKILLILSVVLFSCNPNKQDRPIDFDTNYFASVAINDIKLGDPLPGEWRFHHKENPQKFESYRKANPAKANNEMKIYLLPIGNFSGEKNRLLELTRKYIEVYFQLSTIVLDPILDSQIPDSSKRRLEAGNVQLYTPYILQNLLKGKIPKEGYALMAISEKDLYPSPDWNYVFGIASYVDRVGVSSIYRLYNNKLDSVNFTLCLKRLINTSSHEIGHMFSIFHCTFSKCCMNGSNSLYESDRTPNRLCSECQKKLFWNIEYDNKKRLTELIAYFQSNNLVEDLAMAEKDLKALR